ncbi:hypothetical protein [Bacillus sp. RCC_6_1]|uniref:hypothetical protein n=1 Tax=Bacillus sp. RCC_6_1 TaxID=3239229 RepID=UPI00352350BD
MWDYIAAGAKLLSFFVTATVLLTVVFTVFDYKKLRKSVEVFPDGSIRKIVDVSVGSVVKSTALKFLIFFFNYGLYKDYLLKAKNKKSGASKEEFAVTELVIRHNAKNNTLAYILGGLSILAYIVGIQLDLFQPNYIFQFLTIFMIFVVFIKQKILQFRLKKGYFGTNEYELRQILRFIADEKNKDYFKGDGKGRKIFSSTEDTAEFKEEISGFEAWGGKV